VPSTYTAEYLAGGVVVTHVRVAPWLAYRSAVAAYLLAPDATYLCRTAPDRRPACDRAPGADSLPMAHARRIAQPAQGGFVTPELVVSAIAGAVTRPYAVNRHGRTIAGQHADCVEVTGTDRLTACATDEGVLALVDGRLPGRPPVRTELTRYSPTAPPDAFALPPGAQVRDVEDLAP